MDRACSTHWGDEKSILNLNQKSEIKRLLGRTTRSWNYNIKFYVRISISGCELD
jgi:hypothetical protein